MLIGSVASQIYRNYKEIITNKNVINTKVTIRNDVHKMLSCNGKKKKKENALALLPYRGSSSFLRLKNLQSGFWEFRGSMMCA